MLAKQNDPISIKQKINISPINYNELNKLAEDFGKHFIPQQELSAEQVFWLQTSNPNSEQLVVPQTHVKIEAPKELPKVNNDRFLGQIISQDIVLTVLNSSVVIGDSKKSDKSFVDIYNECLELEAELVKKNDVYIELSKRFSNLEQHFISLEVATQLNQEIFQKDKSCDNQNDPEFQEYFEKNDLKSQLQAKDTTISNLKKQIHSLNAKCNQATVKKDIDEYETINIELEHSVAKLLRENEQLHIERDHLKKTYKELYDSIKKTRVQTKDQCDSLIA
ncbi:hypothetical protein Tco_1484702 [Tanacetum coccineum]